MNPHRGSLAVLAGTGDRNDGVFNLHRGEFHGTAFCLAPNLFITAAHVYEAALATGPVALGRLGPPGEQVQLVRDAETFPDVDLALMLCPNLGAEILPFNFEPLTWFTDVFSIGYAFGSEVAAKEGEPHVYHLRAFKGHVVTRRGLTQAHHGRHRIGGEMAKVIASAACVALKDALASVYWYKSDLRSFLTTTVSNPALLAPLNWGDYKRNIVTQLVDYMAKRQDQYQGELIRLMAEVSRVDDFSHLARLEGGKEKADAARKAVAALRKHTAGHDSLVEEQRKIEERRRQVHASLLRKSAVRDGLDKLNGEYLGLLSEPNPQQRGYRLEKLLRTLFELCDLDPRASFKIVGEQIDGAFTFEGTDYLFEGKWQQELVSAADLDVLAGKLSRKLDNTLGLFLSVNGFSEDGVKAHSSGRRLMILMDGSDLMAVLEGRIDLVQLLLRKRREGSQTGNIYLKIHEIL